MVTVLWLLGSFLLRLRYRIRTLGRAEIAARGRTGILFLPNHPALVDPILVYASLYRAFRPRSLGDKDRLAGPLVSWIARKFGVIPFASPETYADASKAHVSEAIARCVEVLRSGENLVLYPAGRLQRTKLEDLGANSAVASILEAVPQARVVLVRSRGLWGSSASRASGSSPELTSVLVRGALRLLASFVFFAPRRPVSIELVEPTDLPRSQGRAVLNRALEAFYNEAPQPNLYVPYTIWERGGTRELPDPSSGRPVGDPSSVSPNIRAQVLAKIREMTGVEIRERPAAETRDMPGVDADLARDLGMDSLSRMDLLAYIEREFGHPCSDPGAFQTVGDVLLAAAGRAVQGLGALKPVPATWFSSGRLSPAILEGDTVAEVFLAQARRGPSRVVLADQTSGVRTYRDIVLAVLVLAPHLARLPGEYLGVMLPASGGAAIVFLAAIFAGKVPVMINWTVGPRNLTHAMDLLGIHHVITAGALLSRLSQQGVALGEAQRRTMPIEELGKRITRLDKIRALLRAYGSWRALRRARIADTAVVLFTSGSESLPKAVPLTHANLLTNLRDILRAIEVRPDDRMIGFLPPFHAFGLTCTVLLPACGGIPVVYHPNPTEGAAVARIVAAYRATLMVGTPTFLAGAVRAATSSDLATLRLVVSGAEKCPEPLYDEIARRWPRMVILEGYGITECSPVVSVNREHAIRRGSIGQPLASVEYAVVDLERHQRVDAGQTGMLFVRGPGIFAGYCQYAGAEPFESFEGKRWYRTGDLVRETADGILEFVGRLKRFVKLGGEMISLPAIEEVLMNRFGRPEMEDVPLAVEASSDASPELVLFSVLEISREQANAALRAAGLSGLHHIRQVRRLDAIPVLGTGKTDYRALRALLDPAGPV